MDEEQNKTLLGREEVSGKYKNQRLWNIFSLFFGFFIVFSLSWILTIQEDGLNNQTIGLITCFPGVIFALLIAEFLSRLLDR